MQAKEVAVCGGSEELRNLCRPSDITVNLVRLYELEKSQVANVDSICADMKSATRPSATVT
jgi:hypothetical protein